MSDDALPDDVDVLVVNIGGRGHFNLATLQEMARAPKLARARYPRATITLTVGGYDEDPRELWQIPEAVDYIRRFARASGLNDWRGSLFSALDEPTVALLVVCDAIDKPHPFVVKDRGPPH